MNRLTAPDGRTHPWPLVSPVEIAGQVCYPWMRVEALPAGCAIEEVEEPTTPPAPPVPRRYSKLGLRRALRAAGLEVAFDAALASSPEALADWQDATELREDDPVLAGAVPALAAAAGVTVEQAWALLAQAEIAP